MEVSLILSLTSDFYITQSHDKGIHNLTSTGTIGTINWGFLKTLKIPLFLTVYIQKQDGINTHQ
jgi:hypothetical protein